MSGILIEEIDYLAEQKRKGAGHPKEDRLRGRLSEIGYLRLYPCGWSVRVYFVVLEAILWMLCLDANKRRMNLSKGMEVALAARLGDVKRELARKDS